eukprot:UN29065
MVFQKRCFKYFFLYCGVVIILVICLVPVGYHNDFITEISDYGLAGTAFFSCITLFMLIIKNICCSCSCLYFIFYVISITLYILTLEVYEVAYQLVNWFSCLLGLICVYNLRCSLYGEYFTSICGWDEEDA